MSYLDFLKMSGNRPAFIIWNDASGSNNGGHKYCPPFSSQYATSYSSKYAWKSPFRLVLRHFVVVVASNTTDGSIKFETYIQGVSGTLSVNVSAGTTGRFIDDTDSDILEEEELLSIHMDCTNSSSGGMFWRCWMIGEVLA